MKISPRNFIIISLLIAIILYYISIFSASHTWNFFALLFLSFVIINILRQQSGLLFFLFCFTLYNICIVNTLIEVISPFLIEVREYPTLTGSAARNSLLSAIILKFSYLIFMSLDSKSMVIPKSRKINKIIINAINPLIFLSILVSAITILQHGTQITLKVDRFFYVNNIIPEHSYYIYTQIPTLGFLAAISYTNNKTKKLLFYFYIIAFIAILLLFGEKFSKILLLLFFTSIPILIKKEITISAAIYFQIILWLLLSVGIIIFTYYYSLGDINVFMNRLYLQGQMLYILDLKANNFPLDFNMILNTKSIIDLMYVVAPQSVVDYRLEMGATFTAPFPADTMYIYGFLMAPIIILLKGILIGISSFIIVSSLKKKNHLISIIAAKIYFLIFIYTIMSEYYLLIKIMIYFSILALSVILIKPNPSIFRTQKNKW